MYGMIDTGCAPTLINYKVLSRLFPAGDAPITNCKVNLIGAGGGGLSIKGSVSLEIVIAKTRFLVNCIVCDELKEDLILGFTFLSDVGATINTALLKISTPTMETDLIKSNSNLTAAIALNKNKISLGPFRSEVLVDVRVMSTTVNESMKGRASVVCRSRNDDVSCDQTVGNINYDCPKITITNITGQRVTLEAGSVLAEILPITEVSTIISEGPDLTSKWDPERIKRLQEEIQVGDQGNEENEWAKKFRDTIKQYPDVFSHSDDEPHDAPYFSFKIKLLNDIPVSVRPFPQPIHLREKINTEIDRLVANKIIEPSTSLYNSRAFFIPKKSGSELRCIVDFRAVNANIQKVPCTVPNIREAITFFHGCTHFIVADLSSSFFQLGIDEECREITAWEVLGKGKFQFRKVPLGLNNSPGRLMQVMLLVIDGLQAYVLCFVDDIIIAGLSEGHLLEVWTELLKRLRKYRLTLRPDKTKLYMRRVFALGHWISAEKGLEPNRDKITSLLQMDYPKTLKQARSFLGAAQYFEMHVRGMSQISRGLVDDAKVRNKAHFKLSEAGKKSFNDLKVALSEATDLSFPDPNSEMILQVDASDHAYASVLIQEREGGPVPIGFSSKRIPETDRKKHINIKEFMSLHHAIVKRWPQYLKAGKFTVLTDNRTIMSPNFLKSCDNARLQRMIADLGLYDFDTKHIPSHLNFIADSLTRFETVPHDSLGLKELFSNDQSPVDRPEEKETEQDQAEHPAITEEAQEIGAVVTRNMKRIAQSHNDDKKDDQPKSPKDDKKDDQPESPNDEGTAEHPIQPVENTSGLSDTFPDVSDAFASLMRSRATSTQMAKLQDEDPDLKYVKNRIKEGMVADQRDKHMSGGQWFHLKDAKMYSVDNNDCLIRTWIENYTGIHRSLIVVPNALQAKLIIEAHQGAVSGHFGRDRTISLLRRWFYFQHLSKQVNLMIACCQRCKHINHEYLRKPHAPLQPFAAKAVNSIVHLDCAGPFASTNGGFRHYVLICCKFSGFCQARAIKTLSAQAIVEVLLVQWIPLMGTPETLVSDRGPEMRAKIVDELCRVMGINHKFTSIYHPQSNSSVERLNSSLKRAIKKMLIGNPRDWHLYLNLCCFAYNTSTSSRHHMTPFFTVTGREARLPIQCINDVAFTSTYVNKEQYNYQLFYKVREIWRLVQVETQASMMSMSGYYNRTTNVIKHQLGDRVQVWRPVKAGTQFRAFRPKFNNEYTITKIVGEYTYQVTGPEGRSHIVNHDLLRPWQPQEEAGCSNYGTGYPDGEIDRFDREEREALLALHPDEAPRDQDNWQDSWDTHADFTLSTDRGN